MTWSTASLGDTADVIRGVTFRKTDATSLSSPSRTPVLRAGNIGEELDLENDLLWVPSHLVSPNQQARKHDIVMCTSSGSPAVVGKSALLRPKVGRNYRRVLRSYSDEVGKIQSRVSRILSQKRKVSPMDEKCSRSQYKEHPQERYRKISRSAPIARRAEANRHHPQPGGEDRAAAEAGTRAVARIYSRLVHKDVWRPG